MAKRIKNNVPELLKERRLTVNDLHYGARITANTARRWADSNEAQEINQYDPDTLVAICGFLGVDIGDLFTIVDE